MIKKHFLFDESDLKIIETVKNKQQFISDAETLRYILRRYKDMDKVEQGENRILISIMKAVEEREKLLMDAMNTILIKNQVEKCIPVRLLESPVFIGSRLYEKEKLAQLKQRKDNHPRAKIST